MSKQSRLKEAVGLAASVAWRCPSCDYHVEGLSFTKDRAAELCPSCGAVHLDKFQLHVNTREGAVMLAKRLWRRTGSRKPKH